jgi:hypothetical protein
LRDGASVQNSCREPNSGNSRSDRCRRDRCRCRRQEAAAQHVQGLADCAGARRERATYPYRTGQAPGFPAPCRDWRRRHRPAAPPLPADAAPAPESQGKAPAARATRSAGTLYASLETWIPINRLAAESPAAICIGRTRLDGGHAETYPLDRHRERSEAIHGPADQVWIAASLRSSQ